MLLLPLLLLLSERVWELLDGESPIVRSSFWPCTPGGVLHRGGVALGSLAMAVAVALLAHCLAHCLAQCLAHCLAHCSATMTPQHERQRQ